MIYCHDIVHIYIYICYISVVGLAVTIYVNQHETCCSTDEACSGWWAKALDAATGHDKPNTWCVKFPSDGLMQNMRLKM